MTHSGCDFNKSLSLYSFTGVVLPLFSFSTHSLSFRSVKEHKIGHGKVSSYDTEIDI